MASDISEIPISLSTDEADALRETLAVALSELSFEIADTESQDFRDRLKNRQELLRAVMRRLGPASS